MKNAVFYHVMKCSSCKNRRFGGTYRSVFRLLVTANDTSSSPMFVNLMIEAISSSETLVLTSATGCNIREDDILHNQSCENFKPYTALTGWDL
jgi:hypothetical protein